MTPEDIEHIDREFMRNQERDRMNERTAQIWPIFLSLSTVFGFIGLQNQEGAYLVGLFPILVSCLAQHLNDSEQTLRNNRKYLRNQEKEAGCLGGGELYFQEHQEDTPSKGGNKKALRRAFVTTSLLATYLFLSHLQKDHVWLPYILLAATIELGACWQSLYWLTYWKRIVDWWKKHKPLKKERKQ